MPVLSGISTTSGGQTLCLFCPGSVRYIYYQWRTDTVPVLSGMSTTSGRQTLCLFCHWRTDPVLVLSQRTDPVPVLSGTSTTTAAPAPVLVAAAADGGSDTSLILHTFLKPSPTKRTLSHEYKMGNLETV